MIQAQLTALPEQEVQEISTLATKIQDLLCSVDTSNEVASNAVLAVTAAMCLDMQRHTGMSREAVVSLVATAIHSLMDSIEFNTPSEKTH
jgi:hypothetical protein